MYVMLLTRTDAEIVNVAVTVAISKDGSRDSPPCMMPRTL